MDEEAPRVISFISIDIDDRVHNKVSKVGDWTVLGIWDGVREPVNQIWHNICWPLKTRMREDL